MFPFCSKAKARKRQQELEAMLQRTPQRLMDMQGHFRQLDTATQYQIAKESAQQVGRTDEAFIQELLREVRGNE